MTLKKVTHFAAFVAPALLLAACSAGPGGFNPHLLLSRNIVSTRAQNSTQFIALIKFQKPALMETAQRQNGRVVVDPDLLAEINKEQEAGIAALKALSSDVQILYRYKMVLNGVAALVPVELEDKIKAIGTIAQTEGAGNFERPRTLDLSRAAQQAAFNERNSSKFIGAAGLNARGITGKGIKVGIIDTGIDYTHAMFGGAGTEEAYQAVDPSADNAAFPSAKVVGGVDLVGTAYNAAAPDFVQHIPVPDMNPLDEAGHGTHVAGTVAGHGDGVNSYDGMAPEAVLHAIKVFGASGSTNTSVVIAALEYSADPNADGQNNDQLDVVNLSLGSSYGNPNILYGEAIRNLVNGGTVVVASAGNSGHKDYIVGAPGTADEALSVAASIDNGDHLWKFQASQLNIGDQKVLVEAIEAATSKPIAEAGPVSGELVFLGTAAEELSPEQKAAVSGKVAFIDRGIVAFNDKVKRAAEAGAIGVVVANNVAGAALKMGTTDTFQIPAIMITLEEAQKVKAALATGPVTIDFKTDVKIEKPELIDTLTDFTSKGPRSADGHLKPEISAPGENVISAAVGKGTKTVQMSGTSMAAPHMAGVMALVKQAHPGLSAEELKSLVMGTSKTIADTDGQRYPVSMQGSGRVQADKAAASRFVTAPASFSLGEVALESHKTLRRELTVRNLSAEAQELDVAFEGNGFITLADTGRISVAAGASKTVSLNLTLDATAMGEEKIREMDGWILLRQNGAEVYRVPVLAVAHKLSSLEAGRLTVNSTSETDSGGAAAELTIRNKNGNGGEALLFNLIGQDERKPNAASYMSADCDLQSAGYRLLSRTDDKGRREDVLQVAVKLFKPMTTWNECDISLLIDADGNGTPDQELLGSHLSSIPNIPADSFATTLIDATKARQIRKRYEDALEAAKDNPPLMALVKEDYMPALVDQGPLKLYNNSTVVVLEIPVQNLALTADGALAFKVLVTNNSQSAVEFDDYLSSTVAADMRISLRKEDQSFVGLPESVPLTGAASQTLQLTKGDGHEKLLVLFPHNRFSLSGLHEDSQSQILTPVYQSR